jgi:hypothetical protein
MPQEAREFATWHDAMRWLDDKRATLQLHGWRVDDSPSDKAGHPTR